MVKLDRFIVYYSCEKDIFFLGKIVFEIFNDLNRKGVRKDFYIVKKKGGRELVEISYD